MAVLPILEDATTVGYIFRFVTVKDAVNHWINKDYASSQIVFFSHLRAQISGIISAATILHDSLERMELYDDLKILNRQVNYCYKILASLLNPAEISKYAFGLHNVAKINASVFVKDILQMIGALLRGSNVTFEYNADDDAFIDVDADRFVVLILNAIVNAIQYNIEEVKVIKISVRKTADSCILSFSDNGVGISEDKMAQIFGTKSCINHGEQEEKRQGLGHRVYEYFCKTFNAVPNITSKENFGTTLSFKMPLSNSNDIPEFAESKTTDYLTNRFSNVYVAISDIVQINYF